MPTHVWAVSNNNSASSGYWPGFVGVKTDGIPMPQGRMAISGNYPIYIGALHSYVASGAAGIYPILNYQGIETGGGRLYTNSGGTARFSVRAPGGTMSFGRQTGTGLSVVDENDGFVWGGSTLAGACDWAQVANAPQFSASANASTNVVTFSSTGSSDSGGNPITAYFRRMSVNGGAWGSATSDWGAAYTMTPGNTYQFQLFARNGVGDSLTTQSAVFNSQSSGQRYTGSAWTNIINSRRWSGSSWVNLGFMRRWSGSAWVDLS